MANPYAQWAAPTNPYAPIQVSGPDQFRINNDRRAEDANDRAANAAERTATNEEARLKLEREKFELERRKPKTKEQNDAIAAFKSADMIDAMIADLESKYADGPGKTSGLKGAWDYLPSTTNEQFDKAGDAVRGQVGNLLGFTGGQLNTPAEAAASIGPYLPHASDRDAVILDKINRLKQLSKLARDRSVSQLGGAPDANGNIVPITPQAPQPGAAATYGAQGGALATGDTKFTPNDAGSALATQLARAGLPDDQINAALQAAKLSPLTPQSLQSVRGFLKANPGFQGNIPGVGKVEQTNLAERMLSSPVGAGATSYLDAATAGVPSLLAGQEGRDKLNELTAENPGAALTGGALGSLTATLGLGKVLGATQLAPMLAQNAGKAALATDVGYGGLYGFNTADAGNGALGAALGAGGAAVGNRVGGSLARGLGKAVRGVQNPAIDFLRSQGIPLTGGQIAGGLTKRIEDTLAGYGLAGSPLRSRLNEGLDALNVAGYRKGGEEIGHVSNDVGRAGLDALNADKGEAYRQSLGAMNLTQDAPYFADRAAADAAGAQLPNNLRPTFDATMRQADGFVQPGGYIPGENAQAIKQTIRTESRAHKNVPGGQFVRNALGQADDAFMGMARRQTPEAFDLYSRADLTHGRSKVLEKAVNSASGKPGDPGLWTGAQLASALKGANVPQDAVNAFRPLADNAIRVLPSQVADSGTAGRLALGAFAAGSPLAALGFVNDGMSGAAQGEGLGIGTALALASLNTKAGQKIMTRMLLSRPSAMVPMGNYLVNTAAPVAGMLGRGAGATGGRILAN